MKQLTGVLVFCIGGVLLALTVLDKVNVLKNYSHNGRRLNGDQSSSQYTLVTGVGGYTGFHAALALLKEGRNVVGIDSLSHGSKRFISELKEAYPNFKLEFVDPGSAEDVQYLFQTYKIASVSHFADFAAGHESVTSNTHHRSLMVQTELLVDTMIDYGVTKLIFSSSCAVYGHPDKPRVKESAAKVPTSPYGRYKMEAEEYIRSKSKITPNFSARILRSFNVGGSDITTKEEHQPSLAKYSRLWASCLDVVFKRTSCVHIHSSTLDTPDGTSMRDYVHIDDLMRAFLKIHDLDGNLEPFEAWNVATNKATSSLEFVEAARRVTGVFIPVCFGEQQSNNPSVLHGDNKRLKKMTGWSPQYANIESILEEAWKIAKKPYHDERLSKKYDVCVVGAGLSSAVLAERHVSTFNHSVLVLEKRDHIGGNCYDFIDKETGIRVSKYGVHLFHTKFTRVWEYIQRFSRWTPWEHHCVARVGDKHIPVPINIDSVNSLFDKEISSEKEMEEWLRTVQITPPDNGVAANSEEVGLQRVGRVLYDLIFKPYTIKQWNKDPKDLAPSVLARIPVRTNHDDRYFTDPYQALPTDGYTRIFENMFNSPQITVMLDTNYFDFREKLQCGHTYFTGPIDAYFAQQGLDKLEYRSLEFERQVFKDTEFFQPMAHVNYPALEYNYTRAIEYKHILHQKSKDTVVFFEHSSDVGEPYYPVPNERNQALYSKYQQLAEKEEGVTFVGRLATYKYLNMDQTVLNALQLFDRLNKEKLERKCTPGKFSSPDSWKALFPGGEAGMGLEQKGIVLVPVGRKSASSMNLMIQKMKAHFDFLLVTYDDYDWTTMSWYDEVEWVKQPPDSGTNWVMAKRFLTPERVQGYSHVCAWDDDLIPTEEFDESVFLQWLQQLDGLDLVQPMIRRNAHDIIEGSSTAHRPQETHVHEVWQVEVMAPCYEAKLWTTCIEPKIQNKYPDPKTGDLIWASTGWGIDGVVHHAECAPERVHTLRLPLDHLDDNGLAKGTGLDELEAYQKLSEKEGWGFRKYWPYRNYEVFVNETCGVTMREHSREQ